MASLVIFLCFSFVMFAAGYEWRKHSEAHSPARATGAHVTREAVWDGMIGKL